MDHDAAHKYIYALPEVTADLLRLVLPDWAGRLDFATLEDASSEFFDARHGKRVSDMVWRVHLRGGRLKNGGRPRILALIEFQSEVDRRMARRMREYADLLLDRLVRRGLPQREGGLPWVLPIVVYNGSEPWTAFGRSSDLAALPWAGMERALALMQPQKYAAAVCGRGLDGRWAAGGGLALGQSGGGDGSLAAKRPAEGAAAAAAGGVGPLPRPGERIVPAGAARLGAGAVDGQDGQGRRLSVLR